MVSLFKSDWEAARRGRRIQYYNNFLVKLTAKKLNLRADGANTVLMGRVAIPKRNPNVKAAAEIVAYRYLKRSASNFYEMLEKMTVKAYIAYIHKNTDKAGKVPIPGRKT